MYKPPTLTDTRWRRIQTTILTLLMAIGVLLYKNQRLCIWERWTCQNLRTSESIFVKSGKCQNLNFKNRKKSESENVRIHQDWKFAESENVRILQNRKMSESFKIGKCQNVFLQNIALLENSRIFINWKTLESENVRIFSNWKMSESENVRILQNRNMSELGSFKIV